MSGIQTERIRVSRAVLADKGVDTKNFLGLKAALYSTLSVTNDEKNTHLAIENGLHILAKNFISFEGYRRVDTDTVFPIFYAHCEGCSSRKKTGDEYGLRVVVDIIGEENLATYRDRAMGCFYCLECVQGTICVGDHLRLSPKRQRAVLGNSKFRSKCLAE